MLPKKTAFLSMIFLLICMFLPGCDRVGMPEEAIQKPKCQFGSFSHVKQTVSISVEDAEKLQLGLFAITDQSVYYVLCHSDDSEETIEDGAAEKNPIERYVLCASDKEGNSNKAILETDDKPIRFIQACEAGNGEEILSVLLYDRTHYYIYECNEQGEIRAEICVNDTGEEISLIEGISRLNEDGYLLYGLSGLFLIDRNGNCIREKKLQNQVIMSAIALNENVYLSYCDELEKKYYFSQLDVATLELKNEFLIEGNGKPLIAGEEGEILAMAPGRIVSINPEQKSCIDLFDLEGFVGTEADMIQTFSKKNGEYQLLRWGRGGYDGIPKLLSFVKKDAISMEFGEENEENVDEYGRRIVTIYDPYGILYYEIDRSVIDEYNRTSDDYKIEVINEPNDPSLLVAAKKTPDILYMENYSIFETYKEEGYLENLTPYIEKSERLKLDDLQDFVFQCFGYDGGLYGITKECAVNILAGKATQVGTEAEWTVDEFLTFLEADPKIYGYYQLDQMQMLLLCVSGNMEKYVNFDEGKAYFLQEPFRMLLSRIKEMRFEPKEFPKDGTGEDIGESLLILMGVEGVKWIGEARFETGDQITLKSLPNDEGKFISSICPMSNFAILANGSCKEGAYDFLEYFLLREEGLPEYKNAEPASGNGMLYSVKRMYGHEMELVKGHHEMEMHVLSGPGGRELNVFVQKYEITQDDIDQMSGLIEKGMVETRLHMEIKSIIYQEVQAYFLGQKGLDDTCDVIQRRVQLMLNENK